MKELLNLAKKFLDENLGFNEIELSDGFGNKVRLMRNAPTVWYSYSQPYYQYAYGYNPNQPESK